MKNLIKIDSPNATHIELKIYYALGGINYFTYKTEKRGYYFSVTPVTINNSLISFTAFSGVKVLLHECTRKSTKSYTIALSKLTLELQQSLINQILGNDKAKSTLQEISKSLGISLPARFEGMTKTEIENLPVHIVGGTNGEHFENLFQARKSYDLSTLCGPFGSEKRDHLRFETKEIYNILSA